MGNPDVVSLPCSSDRVIGDILECPVVQVPLLLARNDAVTLPGGEGVGAVQGEGGLWGRGRCRGGCCQRYCWVDKAPVPVIDIGV